MDRPGQPNSTLKRQRDDDNESEQCKSQRTASPAESKRTKKIIDLHMFDLCLEKIFGFLDLQSLFNVAIANEYLRPAAAYVYKRKFGANEVYINGNIDFLRQKTFELQWYNQIINIHGLKSCLLYLRCFGTSITKLLINYHTSQRKCYNYVHEYINQYCKDSLTSISFLNMPNIAIEPFQEGFVNVEEVNVNSTVLKQWPTFVECFPNVRRVKICREPSDMEPSVMVEKPFKYLEHLDIVCSNTAEANQIAADLLHGIHQLKSLKVYDKGDVKAPIRPLLDIIKENPLITELTYRYSNVGHIAVEPAEVKRIITEHAALAVLQLECYLFTADDAIALIRQLKSLKEFHFQLKRSSHNHFVLQLNDEWETNENGNFYDPMWLILKRKV